MMVTRMASSRSGFWTNSGTEFWSKQSNLAQRRVETADRYLRHSPLTVCAPNGGVFHSVRPGHFARVTGVGFYFSHTDSAR